MMFTFLKMVMKKDCTLEIDINRQWVKLSPIVVDANGIRIMVLQNAVYLLGEIGRHRI